MLCLLTCFLGLNLNPSELNRCKCKEECQKRKKKSIFFHALLTQVPLSPTSSQRSATRVCLMYKLSFSLPLLLVALVVTYTLAKNSSHCCSQPGSGTHCGGGDSSSHPTPHCPLTQTLRAGMTAALPPVMLQHPAPSRSKSWSQQETDPCPLAREQQWDAPPQGSQPMCLGSWRRAFARCLGG